MKPKKQKPGPSITLGQFQVKPIKRTAGPSCGIDTRYQIDPATFKGGELTAEWKRLRGER